MRPKPTSPILLDRAVGPASEWGVNNVALHAWRQSLEKRFRAPGGCKVSSVGKRALHRPTFRGPARARQLPDLPDPGPAQREAFLQRPSPPRRVPPPKGKVLLKKR